MEEGDGTRNEDQFHRNEAISAVADEGFMVDEEEDDYEDLYNDVNVGDGVFRGTETNGEDRGVGLGFKAEEEINITGEKKDVPGAGEKKDILGSSGAGGGVVEEVGDIGFIGESDVAKSNVGAEERDKERGSEGQNRTNMLIRMGESEGQNRNNMPVQGVLQQPPQAVGGGGGGGGSGSGGGGYGVGNNGGGGTTLYVGDLHWWTTDAELETELCKYGQVKEVKFFDEKASGKSKGYCQVDFYDSAAAAACKEGMNGHVFNGKACTVQFGTPFSIRRMGEAQVNRNQAMGQQNLNGPPGRRGLGDGGRGGGGTIPAGGNYQGGDGGRGYGRGNWGRGNGQGMGGRGPGGPMRNRIGGMGGGRGMMGNGGGNGFGQGIAPNPQMMHPQSMMGQGFDPGYGPNMGRMGGYGGFPVGPTPPFSGMLPAFPPVGGVSMPGVAPHVNPAFFGRGMPGNGMGMMPTNGMDGHGMGMWGDPNAGGWGGEDPGGRVAESSYGEDATSDHQYGDASHDRGGRLNTMKEKDRGSEKDWSGPSTKKYRDDRDLEPERDMPREKDAHDYDWSERRLQYEHELSRERGRDRDHERERDRDRDRYKEDRERDRDRYREERGRSADHHKYKDRGLEYDDMDRHRYKEREPDYDDEWERGRSSKAYSKSRPSHEEDHRARSRDVEYSKRRRLPSE